MTTMALLEQLNIPHLIFSSSCTVYGTPAALPVNEDTPMGLAENPYGATKQVGEILYDQFFKSNKYDQNCPKNKYSNSIYFGR